MSDEDTKTPPSEVPFVEEEEALKTSILGIKNKIDLSEDGDMTLEDILGIS